MALAYLSGTRGRTSDTHASWNVSPFHDPLNPQFGVGTNQSSRGPALGTAAELRARKQWRLRGSYNRSSSEPPAEAHHAPSDPPAPPEGHRGDDDLVPEPDDGSNVYAWDAERLDTLDAEVYVNIASQLHQLHLVLTCCTIWSENVTQWCSAQ